MFENATNIAPPNQFADVRILLITNQDYDNLGDQVIEACAISLLKTAIKNLGIESEKLIIDSSPLAIITDQYCATDDPKLLTKAYEKIKASTIVVFGGAPVFNYAYEWFFKKTATILHIAKELGKPVIFSAIGIDAYDEQNERCQLLKHALHNGSVVQVTTRDGIEHLRNYANAASNTSSTVDSFPIALVSDPAVFTNTVFANSQSTSYVSKINDDVQQSYNLQSPKIGLFVIRAAAFSDNRISFSRDQIQTMWRKLCIELEARNYEYELLTSGYFADEAFLGELIDSGILPGDKCVRNLNTPEALLERLSSYDGVISCRLHPSIISYSYNIPSISLVWNPKVTDFYKHISYPERAISVHSLLAQFQEHEQDNPQNAVLKTDSENADVSVLPIINSLEQALSEGVSKDQEYLDSVYVSLVKALANVLNISSDSYKVFSGQQLLDSLPKYPGTRISLERDKISQKFTRCYRNYINLQTSLRNLRAGNFNYELRYHSGASSVQIKIEDFSLSAGSPVHLASGNIEYIFPFVVSNHAPTVFSTCGFTRDGKTFLGWKARFRIGDNWFWCLKDGGLIPRTKGSIEQAALFAPGEPIPTLPVRRIDVMVAEAIWQSTSFRIHYNSGRKTGKCTASYDNTNGTVRHLKSGSVEYSPTEPILAGSTVQLLANQFSYQGLIFAGWRLRLKQQNKWYWYLQNGKLVSKQNYNQQTDGSLHIFEDKQTLPTFTGIDVESMVLEATWKPKTGLSNKLFGRSKQSKSSK